MTKPTQTEIFSQVLRSLQKAVEKADPPRAPEVPGEPSAALGPTLPEYKIELPQDILGIDINVDSSGNVKIALKTRSK